MGNASPHWGQYEVQWESWCALLNQFYDNPSDRDAFAKSLVKKTTIYRVVTIDHDGPHKPELARAVLKDDPRSIYHGKGVR